ncbi:MAG: heavy-metal-associated domain-containing protein, partial [Acidimicrobiia bacterium]
TAATAAKVRFMTTTVLHISGMSCQNCVKHVTEALRGVAGVDTVEVSLESASATVHSGVAVSREAMKAAVEEAGYQLTA